MKPTVVLTLSLVSFVSLCVLTCEATLSKSDKKRRGKKAKKTSESEKEPPVREVSGPRGQSVFDLALVSESVTGADILANHAGYHEETGKKRFATGGHVLGYVTPWNNHGYDVAKTFAPKFSLISPVWLQLLPRSQGGGKFTVGGAHDIDKGWTDEVREKSGATETAIVPRLLFERFTGQDYVALFKSDSERKELSALITKTIVDNGFDGVVLELWSQLGGQAREEISDVITEVGRSLHKARKYLILAVPPPFNTMEPSEGGMFSRADFDRLRIAVDFFSLMTYDFSNVQSPGPNAPLPWMRACVEALDPRAAARDQILLGLNLYGLRHTGSGGGHVLGRDLVDLLKKVPASAKMRWDSTSEEHFIEVKVDGEKMTIFYPTLKSLEARVSLARELGTGISMWEIGQGLDYFYDLF